MASWLGYGKLLSLVGAALVLTLISLGFVLSHPDLVTHVTSLPSAHASCTPDPTAIPTSSGTPVPSTQTPNPSATPLPPTPTRTSTQVPTPTPTPTSTLLLTRVLKVPVILQELPLSCEFAGMRMLLAGLLGTPPSEEQLLDCMPGDPNPYLGFRGDPAGYNRHPDDSINWDNYGAYAPAVAETLNRCVLQPGGRDFEAVAVSNASYKEVAQSILEGYPVIVWIAKRGQPPTTRVDTPQGQVQLVFGEHVWVVVGYHEDGTFDAHDPYPQRDRDQTFHVRTFPNWDLFERMAVFVEPRDGDKP